MTTLANFSGANDNAVPFAGLVQATDGNFYGAAFTNYRDGNCCGGVFKITPSGKYTVIHQFVDTDGNGPYGLFPYTGGPFYGVTSAGGKTTWGPSLMCPSALSHLWNFSPPTARSARPSISSARV